MSKPLPPMVIMGVSGTGKNCVGEFLALELGIEFLDGDNLHPLINIEKMRAGIPLDDEDRVPWLNKIGEQLAIRIAQGESVIIACSALKRRYRELLRRYAPDLLFIHLVGGRDVLESRMATREGHFMPVSLLDSQLATLEPLADFERFIEVDIFPDLEDVRKEALAKIRANL